LERFFDRLDPVMFHRCFQSWSQAFTAALDVDHIAIDGKSQRSSGTPGLRMLHVVNAFATQHRITLGQMACAEKSNEITAIPKLLELLELEGAVVSIDAMGCQSAIAQQIVDAKGDYVLPVKGNQPKLQDAVAKTLSDAMESAAKGGIDQYFSEERGHGRIERRLYTVLTELPELPEFESWPGLKVVGMCFSEREIKGSMTSELRYFIGSRKADAKAYGRWLRGHWGIENNLHWQLDVSFDEDGNREHGRVAAANLALVRKLALALLERHPDKASIKRKRFKAAMSTDYLESVIFGN
jgi:predicted transposase YbfD/YdcC